MKLANLALLSTMAAFFGVVTTGCNIRAADDGEALGTIESQLMEDDADADDTDGDAEAGIDEPLSGASSADPGTPAEGATEEDVIAKVKLNAGRFFQPAGCIESVADGKKVKHLFKACTGPYGLRTFDGTVESTYALADGKLTVTHTFEGFTMNGASVSGSRVVTYSREGGAIVKTRTGSWSGTTKKGHPITHQASFVAKWDPATRCVERDGAAETNVAGRSYTRTVTDYKRCGIGKGGCPESGTVVLSRTKDGDTVSLTLELLGGTRYRITRPSGRQVERNLSCNVNAG